VILGHVALDRTLAGRRVAADGAASRSAGDVPFQMALEVALHRRLVGALGAREHRLAGVTRSVRAPAVTVSNYLHNNSAQVYKNHHHQHIYSAPITNCR